MSRRSDPVSTPTGIIFGCARDARLRPEEATAITRHVRKRRFDAQDVPVMVACAIAALAIAVILLAERA